MEWTRSVLDVLYDTFFGCRHDRLTRPFTLQRETYKVCLDCGRHLSYSAERMQPLSSAEMRRSRKIHAGELKIVPGVAHATQLIPAADSESGAAA